MKNILIALCICLVASHAAAETGFLQGFLNNIIQNKPEMVQELGISPEEINTWILEFLKGAKAEAFLTNSTACVNATDFTAASFIYSVQGYMEDQSLTNYFNITKSMSTVEPMLKTCYDVSTGAFDKIIEHFSRFKDFSEFVQQFFMNAVSKMMDFQNIWE